MSNQNWYEELSTEHAIKNLFDKLGINDHKFVGIESRYTFNDNQRGVIVRVQDKNTNSQNQIIIDMTHGDPSWGQMTEVISGIGSRCDKRIFIYDGNETSDDASKGGIVASQISEYANLSGVPTYLFHIHPDDAQFKLIVAPEKFNAKIKQLVSKRHLQELEFWTIYFGCGDMHGRFLFHPEEWNKDRVFHSGSLDYFSTWNDDGVYIHAVEKSDAGIALLKDISEIKLDKIREHYSNCTIDLYRKEGLPHKLSIRVWDEPFQSFLQSSCHQKYIYGENVFSLEAGFYDHIIPIIEIIE